MKEERRCLVEELGVYVICFKDDPFNFSAAKLGHGNRRLALAHEPNGPWHYWHYGHGLNETIPDVKTSVTGSYDSAANYENHKHWLGVLLERSRKAYWDNRRKEGDWIP